MVPKHSGSHRILLHVPPDDAREGPPVSLLEPRRVVITVLIVSVDHDGLWCESAGVLGPTGWILELT